MKCRVCGREYEACKSAKHDPGVFHWQDVACSPECGSKYLAAIIASRTKVVEHILDKDDYYGCEYDEKDNIDE